MSARAAKLLAGWAALMALLALELCIGVFGLDMRPVLLFLALAMAGIIVGIYMHLSVGPEAVRLFAAAGVLWLLILLALGSLDPVTRIDYPSSGTFVREK